MPGRNCGAPGTPGSDRDTDPPEETPARPEPGMGARPSARLGTSRQYSAVPKRSISYPPFHAIRAMPGPLRLVHTGRGAPMEVSVTTTPDTAPAEADVLVVFGIT